MVNDVLLLFVETANQAVSITNQNGGTWTQVTNSPQGTGTAGAIDATRLTVFWSRYNGTQGAPTTSDSGDHQFGRIYAFRGVVTSGTPFNISSGNNEGTSDTSLSATGATTTTADSLVVIGATISMELGTENFGGAWTNAALASITVRGNDWGTAGNDGRLAVITGQKAAAGAYGATTNTLTVGSEKGLMTIALTGNAGTQTISGTIWEDVDGDADVSLGDGTVGAAGVTVHLWQDAFGAPVYFGSTVTNASGQYQFTGLGDGAYGVIVDSKTIAPSAGFNATFGQTDVWAEQTYGVAGAAYFTGTAPLDPSDLSYLAAPGALYGGAQIPDGGDSDDVSTIATSEHITLVILSGAGATGVDSGFSFSAIVNTRGDNTDDDQVANPGTARRSKGRSGNSS